MSGNNDCGGSCSVICVNSCAGYCAKSCEVEDLSGRLHTIDEWAELDGFQILDPDGFDRSDPLLFDRKITLAEFRSGFPLCTVAPLGWR